VNEPIVSGQRRNLDPVRMDASDHEQQHSLWTTRLVLFLRVMAALALVKGLYHWGAICGIAVRPENAFETQALPYQAGTVFFAVIDLVAAIGLWLAAAWGAVIWLTAVVSMAAVEMLFPQVFGGSIVVVLIELVLLGCYLFLAVQSAREHPN
jgi:fatty acid desaturase